MKKFVTFEGIDGSGKSTISKKVCEKLESEGYKTVLTREPTDSWIGKKVQEFIQKDEDPFVTAFTFIADRIEHCKKIKKWLDEGYIVLCDRYADSTYAYQGAQMKKSIDSPIKWLKDMSKERILEPDRTFLFLIEPKKAVSRIEGRDDLISFERVSFLEEVQENYLKLSEEKRFFKVDATKTKDELTEICYKDIIQKS